MAADGPYSMARTRALLTETERKQIAGEAGDKRRYEAVSRARRRVKDELTKDIEILEEHHPQLLGELRDVVCGPDASEADVDRLRAELEECREQLAEAREQTTATDGGE